MAYAVPCRDRRARESARHTSTHAVPWCADALARSLPVWVTVTVANVECVGEIDAGGAPALDAVVVVI